MDIPTTVNVLGISYNVAICETEPTEEGYCSPAKQTICIRETLSKEKQTQVFLHELIHAILNQLSLDEEYENEHLVQGLAIGLHEALFS